MGIQERKQRERERRRQQIMVAAKNVFTQKGFTKTTMEDIAREAELSPGTLYLYFKNKDELFASLSLRILQYLIIRLEAINQQKKISPRKRIEGLKGAIYDVYEFDPLLFVKMFHLQSEDTFPNLSPELKTEIRYLSGQSLKMIAKILQIGIQKNILTNKYSAETLAEMFWAFFSGVVMFEKNKDIIGNRNSDLKAALTAAFDTFSQGIMKR